MKITAFKAPLALAYKATDNIVDVGKTKVEMASQINGMAHGTHAIARARRS